MINNPTLMLLPQPQPITLGLPIKQNHKNPLKPIKNCSNIFFFFLRRFGTRCNVCSNGLTPTDLVHKAKGHVFHVSCVTCSACHRQLSTGHKLVCFTPSPAKNPSTSSLLKNEAAVDVFEQGLSTVSQGQRQWQQVFLACGDSQECIRRIAKLAASVGREVATTNNEQMGDSMWEQQLISVGRRLGQLGSLLPFSSDKTSYDGKYQFKEWFANEVTQRKHESWEQDGNKNYVRNKNSERKIMPFINQSKMIRN